MNPVVRITADAEPALHALEETRSLLAEFPERATEFRERFLHLPNCGIQVVALESDPAAGAGEIRVQFQISEGFRELLFALRAGDGKGDVV